jgi:CRISPR-associated protein Cmr6
LNTNQVSSSVNTLTEAGWQFPAQPVHLTTNWRLVSGLGIAHPFETGFVFDHVYGMPYLPGSSVKGAARAWAEEFGWDYSECEVIFGPDSHPPDWQPDRNNRKRPLIPAQGHVVFFDAYPTEWPELEVDILNPHYKDYYEGKQPPADWLNPEPTYFLTVKADQPWEFVVGVAPESEEMKAAIAKAGIQSQQELLKFAEQAVSGAATELGMGGKTAVGYGYFREG